MPSISIREQLACLGIRDLTLTEIKQGDGNYESPKAPRARSASGLSWN
jgi:hypothetical protein